MSLLHAHRFAGTLGQPFAGDAVYSNLAGTVPTLVNAGDGETGLQFAGGAQGLVVATIPSTTGRLVYDVVVEFAAASTAPVEIVQLRGAAKVASLNRTSDGRLQLSNAAASGTGLASGVAQAPVGTKFRVVLDANNAGNVVATIYATDDPGASNYTLTVPQAATAITSVRLGYSGTGGTGTYRASWPVLATTPGEVGARNYGGVVAPPAAGYLLDWSFAGTNGAEFTSDARFTHLAGAKPTIVRAVEAKGLRFVGGTEGIVEHLFDPAPDPAVSLKVDTVWRLSERVTATAVVGQLRAGAARGPEFAFTDTNQLRLVRLSGTTAVPVATTTVELPVGDLFRIQLVEDDGTLTLHLFADDTSTDPIATLATTSTSPSTPIDATALRLGVITKTGLGAALVDVFRPRAATALTPGPPTYPALPAEPPQVRAVTPTPAEPWSDVDLLATPIAGSSPIASTLWTPGAGSPPLKPGAGAARTVSARAAMRTKTYPYTVTTTAVDGQTATATVGMVVLPATAGIPQVGAVLVDDDLVTPLREAIALEQDQTEGPVPLDIVISNFQPLAPTTTGRVFTLQTNEGVPVTRVMEYLAATEAEWVTHSVVDRPDGRHTAGFTDQTPDTAYETRMTFSALGFTPRVITSATPGFEALAYRTAATPTNPQPPSSGPGVKRTWAPPVLEDPIVWNISETNRTINVPSDRDVYVVPPKRPLDVRGGFELVGGRDVVWIGGEYRFDTPYYLPQNNSDGVRRQASGTNRMLKFRGRSNSTPHTYHFEGWKVWGDELFEGLNWKAYGDTRVTVRQQNIWVGRVRAFVPNPVDGGQHDGGDWWQPIEDPYNDQIDGLQCTEMDYQCLFLQPTAGGTAGRQLGTWDYRNVQLTGGDTPKELLAMNGSEPPASRRKLTNVWVRPRYEQGQTNGQAVKGEWIGLQYGTAPTPMVDPSKVGIGYVQPGYLIPAA